MPRAAATSSNQGGPAAAAEVDAGAGGLDGALQCASNAARQMLANARAEQGVSRLDVIGASRVPIAPRRAVREQALSADSRRRSSPRVREPSRHRQTRAA